MGNVWIQLRAVSWFVPITAAPKCPALCLDIVLVASHCSRMWVIALPRICRMYCVGRAFMVIMGEQRRVKANSLETATQINEIMMNRKRHAIIQTDRNTDIILKNRQWVSITENIDIDKGLIIHSRAGHLRCSFMPCRHWLLPN